MPPRPKLCRTPGFTYKARLNDCPHERKPKGAHLAAFVSCSPLFDSTHICATPRSGKQTIWPFAR